MEPGTPQPKRGGTASIDLAAWKTNLQNTLPSGDGTVAFSGADNTIVEVRVQWDDERGDDDVPLVFITKTRL